VPVERTIRTPKRPLAYALMAVAAALILAASVAATWRIAHSTPEAPMEVGRR
jgi:hypothetical protein